MMSWRIGVVVVLGGRGWLRGPDEEQRDRRDGERHGIDEDREGGARPAGRGRRRGPGRRSRRATSSSRACCCRRRRDRRRSARGRRRDRQHGTTRPGTPRGTSRGTAAPSAGRRRRTRSGWRAAAATRIASVGDEERPAPKPVDPGPREEPDEQDRQAAGDHEERHLRRARAEDEQGHERDRRAGHDRAELGDGLAVHSFRKSACARATAPSRRRDGATTPSLGRGAGAGGARHSLSSQRRLGAAGGTGVDMFSVTCIVPLGYITIW